MELRRFTDSPAVNPRERALMIGAIALGYAALIIALVRGLGGAPAGLGDEQPIPALIAVNIPPPSPDPPGASAPAGKKAKPKEIIAAPARIKSKTVVAALAASTGKDARSGASAAGIATGGGGAGAGTGNGARGIGAGGGRAAQRAVKIAGDITSVRDYPAKDRAERAGKQVIVVLRVGTTGEVKSCRVQKPSGVGAADAATCALAVKRFRFRPALDQNGIAIESDYGWEQHWNAP